MATTYLTGPLRVRSGETTELTLPKGEIVSRRARWRGVDETRTVDSASGTTYLAAGVEAEIWRLTPPSYTRTVKSSSNSNVSISLSWDGLEHVWKAKNNAGSTQSTDWWIRYEKDYHTENPKVTVGGIETTGPASLSAGTWSSWYDVTGITAGTTNSILHTIGGSGDADIEIEVVMVVALQVDLVEPVAYDAEARNDLVFELDAVQFDGCTDTVWYPRIQLNASDAWGTPDFDWDSHTDQTGWAYDNGGVWTAFPAGGAPVSARCRFTPADPSLIDLGWQYWRGMAYDGDISDFGDPSAARQVQVLLAVYGRKSVTIAGVDWTANVRNLVITQTTMGQLGAVEFEAKVDAGVTAPAAGDDVAVAVRDAAGNVMQFNGEIDGDGQRLEAKIFAYKAVIPDSKLARRVCTADITTSQDVGLSLKDLIDTYCAELDSSGIDTSIGVSRPVECIGKTVLDVFREIASENDLVFWVDSTASPAKVYCWKRADLGAAIYAILRGQSAAG